MVLIRPDGTMIETSIKSIELIMRRPPVTHAPFTVNLALKKEDVPIGTEAWISEID